MSVSSLSSIPKLVYDYFFVPDFIYYLVVLVDKAPHVFILYRVPHIRESGKHARQCSKTVRESLTVLDVAKPLKPIFKNREALRLRRCGDDYFFRFSHSETAAAANSRSSVFPDV